MKHGPPKTKRAQAKHAPTTNRRARNGAGRDRGHGHKIRYKTKRNQARHTKRAARHNTPTTNQHETKQNTAGQTQRQGEPGNAKCGGAGQDKQTKQTIGTDATHNAAQHDTHTNTRKHTRGTPTNHRTNTTQDKHDQPNNTTNT